MSESEACPCPCHAVIQEGLVPCPECDPLEDQKLAVKKGAEWLDGKAPLWREYICIDKLEMNHSNNCILGQVFGDYFEAPFPPEAGCSHDHGWEIDHGFWICDDVSDESLRHAWVDYLRGH